MQRPHCRYQYRLRCSLTHVRLNRVSGLDDFHRSGTLPRHLSEAKPKSNDPVGSYLQPIALEFLDCAPDDESIQIAWRPMANLRWPKFCQPARRASSCISAKLNARAADSRASVLVIASR